MAGAPLAMFRPSEISEDKPGQAVHDLRRIRLSARDVLVGISASGTTPYTIGGMAYAKRLGAPVVAITSNPAAPMKRLAEISIVPVVGPEVISGSTRMKAATAQKLVLNMLSTASMVRRGRALSGWMIGVQMTNRKLRERGRKILAAASGGSAAESARALAQSGGRLPVAMLMVLKGIKKEQAETLLNRGPNPAAVLRAAQAEAVRGRKGSRVR